MTSRVCNGEDYWIDIFKFMYVVYKYVRFRVNIFYTSLYNQNECYL